MKKEPIRLTKDGDWYHGDGEVTHKRTIALFFKSVIFKNGKYYLTGEKKPVPFEVEDVAYWVKGLKKQPGGYAIKLSNETEEDLNISSLNSHPDNGFYCEIANGAPAKFERKVYYELMKKLVKKQGYLGLEIDDVFYPLQLASTAAKATPAKKKAKKKAPAKKKSAPRKATQTKKKAKKKTPKKK